MKKKYIGILIFLLVLIMGSLFLYTSKQDVKSAHKSSKETLIPVNNDEVLQFIKEKKTGIIYIGRPTCPHCQKFLPNFKKALKEKNQQAYYFNTDDNRNEEEKMNMVLSTLNVSSVPIVVEINNGTIQSVLQGENDFSQIVNWLDNLNE